MSGLSGKKEGNEKTRDVLRLAVSACLHIRCLARVVPSRSAASHFKRTCGMTWPGRAALQVGGSVGVWDEGWKGWHWREEEENRK